MDGWGKKAEGMDGCGIVKNGGCLGDGGKRVNSWGEDSREVGRSGYLW
jgi:hypothetical protein